MWKPKILVIWRNTSRTSLFKFISLSILTTSSALSAILKLIKFICLGRALNNMKSFTTYIIIEKTMGDYCCNRSPLLHKNNFNYKNHFYDDSDDDDDEDMVTILFQTSKDSINLFVFFLWMLLYMFALLCFACHNYHHHISYPHHVIDHGPQKKRKFNILIICS